MPFETLQRKVVNLFNQWYIPDELKLQCIHIARTQGPDKAASKAKEVAHRMNMDRFLEDIAEATRLLSVIRIKFSSQFEAVIEEFHPFKPDFPHQYMNPKSRWPIWFEIKIKENGQVISAILDTMGRHGEFQWSRVDNRQVIPLNQVAGWREMVQTKRLR